MDYFAYPENINEPSNVTRGSNTVEYQPRLIQLHAVVRNEDGTMRSGTECGRPARYPPEEVEHVPWRTTHLRLRCVECAKATGYMAISDYTGEMVPGRRND